jgi:hypothetical protein
MMTAQKRMEDALAQTALIDLARKVGRKAPPEFSGQVDEWLTDRREKKSGAGSEQSIAVTDITD